MSHKHLYDEIEYYVREDFNNLYDETDEERYIKFRKLIVKYPNVFKKTDDLKHLLFNYIKFNKIHVIEDLIKVGAKLNFKSKSGTTPIDIAKMYNREEIIMLLQ